MSGIIWFLLSLCGFLSVGGAMTCAFFREPAGVYVYASFAWLVVLSVAIWFSRGRHGY